MKKLIYFVLLVLSISLKAQTGDTLYFQNFENFQTGDMIMIDNDHLTPYYSGLETWIISKGTALSSSYLTNGNKTADDWMITPPIDLSANPELFWKAYTQDPDYRDGYQILISTDVNNPSNLSSYDTIFSIVEENNEWTTRNLNLSSYANQTVRLAWRNNSTDKFILQIDDIYLFEQKDYDLATAKINVPYFNEVGNNINISLDVFNYGKNNVDSLHIAYQINNNAPVLEKKIATINSVQQKTINFVSPFSTTKDSIFNLKVWVFKPQGQIDGQNYNDTLSKKFSTWSEGTQNKILLEHFTQASCGPCGQQNPALNALLDSNSQKYVHIAYHTSWPGYDPMYNFNKTESDNRVKFYGVSGVPDVFVNGSESGSPTTITQNLIDQHYTTNAHVKIEINTLKRLDSVFIEVKLISLSYFPVPVTAHVVYVEDKTYNYVPGSNGEKYFPDVMRKMFPDENGTLLPNLKKDNTVTLNFMYKKSSEINFLNSKIAVIIQNDETKEVYANDELVMSQANEIKETENKYLLSIFPNPATNYINIDLKEGKAQSAEIYDVKGNLVIKKTNNFDSKFTINTSNLTNGIYFIKILTDKEAITSKFTILAN